MASWKNWGILLLFLCSSASAEVLTSGPTPLDGVTGQWKPGGIYEMCYLSKCMEVTVYVKYNGGSYTVTQIKNAYPNIVFKDYLLKDPYQHKFGLNISNIPTNVADKIEAICLNLTSLTGLTVQDFVYEERDEGHVGWIIKDKVFYDVYPGPGITTTISGRTVCYGNLTGNTEIWIDPSISFSSSTTAYINDNAPIDGIGDAVGGTGTLMRVGDSTTNQEAWGYVTFNTSGSNCTYGYSEAWLNGTVNSTADLNGASGIINISFINATSLSLYTGLMAQTKDIKDFYSLNASAPVNFSINISTVMPTISTYQNTSVEFKPTWYSADATFNRVYINTVVTPVVISYICNGAPAPSPWLNVSLNEPANNTGGPNNMSFNFTALGSNSTYNCSINMNGSYPNASMSNALNNTVASFNYTLLNAGTWFWNVTCNANSTLSNYSYTFNYTVTTSTTTTTTLPGLTVALLQPTTGSVVTNTNNVSLNYTVVGSNSTYNCSLNFNGSYPNQSAANALNNTKALFNMSTLSNGTYWWNVTCNANATLYNNSVTYNFSVSYPTTTTTTTTAPTTTTTLAEGAVPINPIEDIYAIMIPCFAVAMTITALGLRAQPIPAVISTIFWFASSLWTTNIRFIFDFTVGASPYYVAAGNWEVGSLFMVFGVIMAIYSLMIIVNQAQSVGILGGQKND